MCVVFLFPASSVFLLRSLKIDHRQCLPDMLDDLAFAGPVGYMSDLMTLLDPPVCRFIIDPACCTACLMPVNIPWSAR